MTKHNIQQPWELELFELLLQHTEIHPLHLNLVPYKLHDLQTAADNAIESGATRQ
jgi:hypothetical protein